MSYEQAFLEGRRCGKTDAASRLFRHESWAFIPGYEGLYAVSTFGRVKSYQRSKRGRLVKQCTNERGYKVVYLRKEGIRVRHKVHRLVAFTFLVMGPNQEVDHLNRDRSDNDVLNLCITSRSENLAKRVWGNPDDHFNDALKFVITIFEDPNYKNN